MLNSLIFKDHLKSKLDVNKYLHLENTSQEFLYIRTDMGKVLMIILSLNNYIILISANPTVAAGQTVAKTPAWELFYSEI